MGLTPSIHPVVYTVVGFLRSDFTQTTAIFSYVDTRILKKKKKKHRRNKTPPLVHKFLTYSTVSKQY